MTRNELEMLHGSVVIWPVISQFEAQYSTTSQYLDLGVRVVDRKGEAHFLSYQEIHEKIGANREMPGSLFEPPLGRNIQFRQYLGATAASMYATAPSWFTSTALSHMRFP